MKTLKIYFTLFLVAVSACYGFGQKEEVRQSEVMWETPDYIEYGREIPRTRTICYDSEQAALEGSHEASQYFQPLTGWSLSKSDDNEESVTHKNSFKFPFAWADRELLFYVESADAPYEVYVNGTLAGYNQSAGNAAEFNITEYAEEGINSVEVVLHGDADAQVLVGRSAEKEPFITGETYIVAQPRVRIRDYILRNMTEGDDAVIELGVILKSELLNPKTMMLHYSLFSPEGEMITFGRREREIEMRQEDTIYFVINIPDVKLWSPEEPNLYTLVLKSQNEGRYWEYVPYRIGVRTVNVEEGKLLVNGRTFPLRMAEYEAETTEVALNDLAKLKEQDINTIITSSPQPEWFYDLCDEKGFFVFSGADIDTGQIGDVRSVGGNPANDPRWENSYVDRMESMFYTSCNHPSVIAFSLSSGAGNGYNMYEAYLRAKEIVSGRGDGRPVVFDRAGGEWNTDALTPQTAHSKPETIAERFVLEPGADARPTITIEEKNLKNGAFAVSNNLTFRTLELSIAYVVKQGNSNVSRGNVILEIPAGETSEIDVPYGRAKVGRKPLTVELSTSVSDFEGIASENFVETFTFDY